MSPASGQVGLEQIHRDRRKTVIETYLFAVGTSQLLFWSFFAGTHLGPAPLVPVEAIGGGLFSLLLGGMVGLIFVPRRLELMARWVTRLREGRRARRIAFFPEYVTIGRDIIPLSWVRDARLGDALTIAYLSGAGPETVRVFRGPLPTLARAKAMFIEGR